MRITCPNCQKQLSIADEKIPAGSVFKAVCPGCKESFTVDAPVSVKPQPRPTAQASPVEPDIFPPGAKVVALALHDAPWSETLRNSFQDLGYHISLLEDAETALGKLEVNAYDMIIIQEGGPFHALIELIHSWPGAKRRKTNLVLIGEDGESLHPGLAFKKGADSYFHRTDHARAMDLVSAAVQTFDATYRAWHTAMQKLGKEA